MNRRLSSNLKIFTNKWCLFPSLAYLHHCPQPHPFYFQDSDGPPRPEGVHPPVFSALRQSRVVSSTSEEEEALTEKFLKINCKYITDGKVRHSMKDAAISEYRHWFKALCNLLVMCLQTKILSLTVPNRKREEVVVLELKNQTEHINIQQSCSCSCSAHFTFQQDWL